MIIEKFEGYKALWLCGKSGQNIGFVNKVQTKYEGLPTTIVKKKDYVSIKFRSQSVSAVDKTNYTRGSGFKISFNTGGKAA